MTQTDIYALDPCAPAGGEVPSTRAVTGGNNGGKLAKLRRDCIAVPFGGFTIGGVSAALAATPGLSWAQAPAGSDGYLYGPHMMWGGGWYGMILGPLFMLLVFLAVIAGAVAIARWFGVTRYETPPSHHTPAGRAAPLDILKERFARGEIDKEEFEERRRVLSE